MEARMRTSFEPSPRSIRLCLFEDEHAADFEPLSLTRPVFDLYSGRTSLADKICRFFGPCELGLVVRPYLAELSRRQWPGTPVNDPAWLRAETTILVNARWLPPVDGVVALVDPGIGMVGEEIAYAIVDAPRLADCSPGSLRECLDSWRGDLPAHSAGGVLLRHGWDLVHHNRGQLVEDCRELPANPVDSSLTVLGPRDQLYLAASARIEPMVVFDTTPGPIVIDQNAYVAAFSRIEGPCSIGPRSQVLGARLRGSVTLGPDCRIGGEVEASIVHGFSNKYHEGFLGHSYLGEWVNLGAGTNNSDLRNDYGEVTVTVSGRRIGTGMTKAGCLLGDHTKTGLGTLLNTGSNIGAFCNLLPGGFVPRYVPSFCSWWNAALSPNAELPGLLDTARTVMARRGQELTDAHIALYRTLLELTEGERQRILDDASRRRWRKTG
jgi:UDP-N-acetylglucosamine diphosphorylase/glucosamine-1-phosphate N-acetyltransferase